MGFLEKLRISHRQMAIVLTILALLPIVLTLTKTPIKLPITIGKTTRDFYDRIQELPEGSIVAWANHVSYSGYIGKRDEYRAVVYHLFDRKLKLIMTSFWPDTQQLWTDLIAYSGVERRYNVKYGTDFVIFPFLAGEETALAAVAADFHKAFTSDIYGTPVGNIPLMSGVFSLRDVQLTISDAGSFTFIDMFVRQWPGAYGVKSINTYVFQTVAPYYPRFVQGALDAERGAAEYEILTGYIGEQVLMLDGRNLQGIWVLVTIAMANIVYFGTRGRKAEVKESVGR